MQKKRGVSSNIEDLIEVPQFRRLSTKKNANKRWGWGGGGVGGGKTPIFLRHFDFFGLPRKVRTNHPSYPPRNGSETPCDPKIHAKGDSEYEKMQKNSEKVAF